MTQVRASVVTHYVRAGGLSGKVPALTFRAEAAAAAAEAAGAAAQADAVVADQARVDAEADRASILAALDGYGTEGTLMLPVATRGLLAALLSTAAPVYFDGSTWTYDPTNHWDGRAALAAFNANVIVAEIGADGFAVTKVAGGAAYNGAAVGDVAFAGDYEVWARNPTQGGFDAYVGVVADAGANSGAGVTYGFSIGGGIIYVRRNGLDVTQYSQGVDGINSPFDWTGMVRSGGVTRLYTNSRPSLEGARPSFHTFDGGAIDNAPYEPKASIFQVGARLDMLPIDSSARGTGDAQADPLRVMLVPPASQPNGRTGAWRRADQDIDADKFATAAGDDEAGWAAAFRWLQHKNGGRVVTRRKLFSDWGQQALTGAGGGSGSWLPIHRVRARGVTGNIEIVSLVGTTIRARAGYKHGSFDPVTGAALVPVLPFYEIDKRAFPYTAMLEFEGCSGSIRVRGFKLDGNIQNADVGGQWGDTGWQLPGSGIATIDCTGNLDISEDVESNFHPLDSYLIANRFMLSKSQRFAPVRMSGFKGRGSGRQGVSLVGGRGIVLENFSLTEAAKNGRVRANPASNIDIEPEAGAYADNITLRNGELVDADSNGLIMDSGRTMHVSAEMMRFVGTTGHAAWIGKAGYRSRDSRYVGVVRCLWPDNPDGPVEEGYAAEFFRDEFTDDPAFSPTGVVYGFGPSVAFADEPQVRFRGCKWNMTSPELLYGLLPDANPNAEYHSCLFKCPQPNSQTTGQFYGKTVVIGSLGSQVRGHMIHGRYIVNGVEQYRAETSPDLPSIAADDSYNLDVSMPSAQADDERIYVLRRTGGWGGLKVELGEVVVDASLVGSGNLGTVRFVINNPTDAAIDLPAALLIAKGTRG